MLNRITKLFSFLILFAAFLFVHSCNKSIDSDQLIQDEISEEIQAEKFLEIFNSQTGKYPEVETINGKTASELFDEIRPNSKMGASFCDMTPNCPKTTKTGTFTMNALCVFNYSYEIYDCGNDNYGIFNLQFSPVGGNCLPWNDLVTQNLIDGDLTDYQLYYNYFVVLILSEIEDNEYASFSNNTGQTLIASYIPNICAATCENNGAEEVCGDDCCIRFAAFNNQTQERTTSVFSAGECGGEMHVCSNSNVFECKNFNCPVLWLYR